MFVRTRRVHQSLVTNLTEYARSTPGIETLLDNSHTISGVLTLLTEHWRRKETLRLPQVTDERGRKRPRTYLLARSLVREPDIRISRPSVTAFLKTYQRQAPLSVRELDVLPDMLRFAIVEELTRVMEATHANFREIEDAERWLARVTAALGRPNAEADLAALANEMASEHKVIAVHFGYHLLQRIAQSGRERDLRVVSRRLKLALSKQGVGAAKLPEIVAKGERAQAVVIDRLVAGLHWLAQMRWDKISPPLNAVDAVLSRDPAGMYASLTDDTKAAYRRAIVRIADRTGAHDVEIAREAVRLSRSTRPGGIADSPRAEHVGFFLVGAGVVALEKAFQYQPRVLERVRRTVTMNATPFYLGFIAVTTAALAVIALPLLTGGPTLPFWAIGMLVVAGGVLATEIAVAAAHVVFTRLMPPRPLPQIDCKTGIGPSRRTVVVTPSFFRDQRSTERLLSRMETNYLANQDADVYFAALLDFADAPAAHMPGDEELRDAFAAGIARLNAAYPSDLPRFSFFYRERRWNPREGAHIGWERKRGKICEFNALLRGKTTSYAGDAVAAAARYGHVRYVLTVDEDTELSRDCARALVGTIDHPLNRPAIDPVRRVVTEGYGIVMPRSALRFEDGDASLFATIFGGHPGIEHYSSAVSDLHQDVFGDTIYQGKGIYDVDAFTATMEGRIPENTVLSHDLLEGSYARAGLASNAHIFEGHPAAHRTHMLRLHRWIRGDWQIAGWLFPRRGGVLPVIARWRIGDNLRRSLLPVATVIAVASALFSPANSLAWTVFALAALGAGQLLPAALRVLGLAVMPMGAVGDRVRIALTDLLATTAKTLLLGLFALQHAFIAADAIVRSSWRQMVTKRKLLEWQTAYEAAAATKQGYAAQLLYMWPSALVALAVIAVDVVQHVAVDRMALIWAGAWAAAPFIGAAVSSPRKKSRPVAAHDASYLRAVAAKTFWFFADMVGKKSHWLPPDHFQEEPASKRHAYGLGVSPTNLGMYLMSLAAGRKMGLTTITHFGNRVAGAFASMARLERHRGHFFNWYELRALRPIEPRYVSSVDSANLALVLLAVRNALREACSEPLATRAMFDGLDAELAVLSEWAAHVPSDAKNEAAKRKLLRDALDAATQSRALIRNTVTDDVTPRGCDQMTSGAVHHAVRIRNVMEALRLEEGSESFEHVFLAARHIEELSIGNREMVGQFLGFAIVPTISAVTGDKELRAAHARLSEALARVPSIDDLAEGRTRRAIEHAGFADAIDRAPLNEQEKDVARAWYGEIMSRLTVAEERAGAVRAKLRSASDACRTYYDDMDFAFLYDEERGLFRMGYSAARDAFDEVFYDLFASEANSASIVGVSKNHAPKEHWSYLGRKLVRSSANVATPISWAGSLFEYLGTSVYFDLPESSFWGVSARRAIATHRRFARRHGIPWGMGESASSSTDASGNFHYQAFGEPSLGFKRNLSESVVVAPYTTALALPIVPRQAVANFRRIAREGGAGRYGFYDAVDYTAFSANVAPSGVPVPIYYAHHQGFILASIANVVLDGWVRKMIAGEPDMRVVTQLFEEKMPKAVPVESFLATTKPRSPFSRAAVTAEPRRRYVSARPKEAQWNYLSNGSYRVKLSSTGAGDSRFGDVSITRPNDEPHAEATGTFFYLFDRERKSLWSPTHMPVRSAAGKSSVAFGGQIAVFESVNESVASTLSVAVDHRSPVEVRELTLTNRRATPVTLTFGFCAEMALARADESLTHRNFQNLFLESAHALDGNGVVVSRSDSRTADRAVAAAFLVTTPDGPPDDLRLTRGRETFYGPLVNRADPQIMRSASVADERLPDHTLDTAIGCVATINLRPGETRSIAVMCAAGASRQAAIEAIRPYRKYAQVRKTIAGAAQAGASALTTLGVPSFLAETFDMLASLLESRKHHAAPDLRMDMAPLVEALWKCGLAGERPVVMVSVSGLADLPLVRQMLLCHVYFVHKGIDADIIIFNEHRGGYLRTLEDEIDFLLRMHRESGRTHASRMLSIRAEDFNKYEIERLRLAATVRLSADDGSLAEQVRAAGRTRAPKLPPPFAAESSGKREGRDAASRAWRAADGRTLEFWNGYGGYDRASGEYVIVPNNGRLPPAPWSNVVANAQAGFLATDRGAMFSWSRNSRENKLTRTYNDPLSAETAEAFYVRDETTGKWFSPQPVIGDTRARYEVRHGAGYTEYRTHQGGLLISAKAFVAPDKTVKYVAVTVKNDSGVAKSLALFGYFELQLGNFAHETKMKFAFEPREGNAVVVRNAYRYSFAESRVVAGVAGGANEFATSKEEFLGRFGSLTEPAALARQGLSSRIEPEGEPAVSLCKKMTVADGEARTAYFFLGEAPTTAELPDLLTTAGDERVARDAQERAVSAWRSYPKLSFELPDPSLALLCDRFLPYQTLASRMHARAGFYQIGGAFGFRDQLQDALALLWHDPAAVRAHLLVAAEHQFKEGDVLSWWHPHYDFGARTLLSDQQLWLPYAVAEYVTFTGDDAVLGEELSYLEGDSPDAERRSVVGVFRAGHERGSLYEHCVRAIEKSLTAGEHGLPLIGTADWNDSMNRVGSEGRGESVWLAWFNIITLRRMADIAATRGDADRAARFRAEADRYLEAIRHHGWDGAWFRRAFTDDGVPVGTKSGRSWRIDSISQSWAAFALGKTPQTESALLSAKQEFKIWEGSIPLAWPPSDPELLDLGTLSDYPPGVRENAGQYNHAALWLAQAMCVVGDADAARTIVDAVNPFKRTETEEKTQVYRGEPYAVAADIFSVPTYPGRAGWTWYTASSGVLYRTVVEFMLGLRRRGAMLTFSPAMPSDWNAATVRYDVGRTQYVIRYVAVDADAPVATSVSVDGQESSTPTVTLVDDGRTHEVVVRFRRAAKT